MLNNKKSENTCRLNILLSGLDTEQSSNEENLLSLTPPRRSRTSFMMCVCGINPLPAVTEASGQPEPSAGAISPEWDVAGSQHILLIWGESEPGRTTKRPVRGETCTLQILLWHPEPQTELSLQAWVTGGRRTFRITLIEHLEVDGLGTGRWEANLWKPTDVVFHAFEWLPCQKWISMETERGVTQTGLPRCSWCELLTKISRRSWNLNLGDGWVSSLQENQQQRVSRIISRLKTCKFTLFSAFKSRVILAELDSKSGPRAIIEPTRLWSLWQVFQAFWTAAIYSLSGAKQRAGIKIKHST